MSEAPNGTKAWRKSWRRRWRPTSTYRALNLLEKACLQFIEDNADDEGRTPVTLRQLAEYLSSPREPIAKSTVSDAMRHLRTLGMITVPKSVGQKFGQKFGHETNVYIRVNFKEYQDIPKSVGQDFGQDFGHSSRGMQIEITSLTRSDLPVRKRRERDPGIRNCLDAMRQRCADARGEFPDFPKSARGDLKAIREVLADDDEVLRRWGLFIADSYWPVKSMNAFRRAFQHAKFRLRGASVTRDYPDLPKVPGLGEYVTLPVGR